MFSKLATKRNFSYMERFKSRLVKQQKNIESMYDTALDFNYTGVNPMQK